MMTEFSYLLSGKTTLADALPSPVQRHNSLKDWRGNRLLKSIRMGIAFFTALTSQQKLTSHANNWGSVHDVLVLNQQ